MMSVRSFIKRHLSTIFLALSLLCLILPLFLSTATFDAGDMASHVSGSLERRMARLEKCVAQLDSSRIRNGVWPRIKGLDEDMVIYRYSADTLHSWYNLLPSLPSLEQIPEYPSFQKYGKKCFLVSLKTDGDQKILQGLLLKNESAVNVTKGHNGINPRIHLHGKYDIAPLDAQGGAVVNLGRTPVFKVVISNGFTEDNAVRSIGLRWLALLFFIMAAFSYLCFHRSTAACITTVAILLLLGVVCRGVSDYMGEYSQIFSPTLYAHDGLLNSFGVLLIFNVLLFLCCLAMFMCRDFLARTFSSGRRYTAYCIYMVTVFLLSVFYFFFTLCSIILNSGITLELYRINIVSGFTFAAYLSYAFLSVGLLLLCETFLVAVNLHRGSSHSLLRLTPMLVFSSVAAAGMLITVSVLGFRKEENRVTGWSNRLAVDRNLSIEVALKNVDADIAGDQVLGVLCHSESTEQLVLRRLEDFLAPIQGRCTVSAKVVTQFDQSMRQYMDRLLSNGVSVGSDSHFIYNNDPVKGVCYTGVFPYYSKEKGQANLIVEISDISADNIVLPPSYSYARYEEGQLRSFSGNFAYPTVLGALMDYTPAQRTSFVYKGCRHFVNPISDGEIIVVSRSEEGSLIYFVTFTYLVFLLMLLSAVFRHRQRKDASVARKRFSTRMLTLVVVSLMVTLVAMAMVSVLFVYQRNERNLQSSMSSKISTVQIAFDAACRQFPGPEDMQTPEFMRTLEEVSRNSGMPMDVYSTDGTLLISTAQTQRRRVEMRSLISPEAYRSIRLEYQRYYIEEYRGAYRNFYILYAPIMNATGRIIGIVAMPYRLQDYDFARDAVFHAATMISFFLILLFITVLIAFSIVRAIFRPLVAMEKKMSEVEGGELEYIRYDGDDEISSLVASYNKMVRDLQESTGKLAAAERDKAWSEMARQVAHEIKNPLTPIKLEIQRLQRLKMKNDPNWEAKFDSVSAVVLEHIDILTQTANEFSTFAKLYSEPSTDIDLDKTLSEQVMLFDNRGVEITYLGVQGVHVMGPKPQLIRVFVNLLTNAMQAVENVENPKVMVSLRKGAEGYWDIVFEDNGPGVSAENQEKLFTPNFTTKSSGTGLGLAICRSIIDRCDGKISYSRSFTLSGACFTVSIPA